MVSTKASGSRFLFRGLACCLLVAAAAPMNALVDASAIGSVQQLHANLRRLSGEHVLFGHQETLAYGYDWIGDKGRSDVREVTGAYPSVYGWDFYPLTAHHSDDRYGMTRDNLLNWVRQGAARGGVITFSWHAPNPVTGENFNDKTPAVAAILPGGKAHAKFCALLDELAEFFQAAAPIPIVFRPYHEHNGDWFWWGRGPATEKEFIALWRFTVEYLRDRKGVHNLLYAFSPDRSRMRPESEPDYFYGYPGDDYVDVLGLDNYYDVGSHWNKAPADQQKADFIKSLELVVKLAEQHHKIPALTESGLDQLKVPHWWMDRLYAGLNANKQTRKIAYVLVWRNANRPAEGSDHFHVPHRGHPGVDDFKAFKNTDLILFEDELPGWFTGQNAAKL